MTDTDDNTSLPIESAGAQAETPAPKLPEPKTGGTYTRLPDGTLELVHETKPAEGRVKRSAPSTTTEE